LRTPDKSIVKALQMVDPGLSVQWNRGRFRWEIFSTRRNLPPSKRKRFVHVCTFYLDGVKHRLLETKPIDRWHVLFWEGPEGQYRELDYNLIAEVQSRDSWKMGRLKDILDDDERRLVRKYEADNRSAKENMRDTIKELDGPLRRDIFSSDGNALTRLMRHHPANWNIAAPWKGHKALQSKTGRNWKVKV